MMELAQNFWYPVLSSHELRGKPLGVQRLGLRLVFWRTDQGIAQAHQDRCPHLGATLSLGCINNGRLICPFHGFEFDSSGQCRLVPANGADGRIPQGLDLVTYILQESYGLIWLWHGQPQEVYPSLPFFPHLETGWSYGTVVADWPVHYTRAIENQLDVAHLPFVHRTTIGSGGRTFVDGPYVEADDSGIRVWVTNSHDEGRPSRTQQELRLAAEGKEPGLSFLFPGIWLLNISPKLKNMVAFVPINEQMTRYYIRTYHKITNPLLALPFEWVMGLSNRYILAQDRRVVVTQTPIRSSDARSDRLIGADRAIAQYRRLQEKFLSKTVNIAN